ncbi:MAG: hypothetical protein Q7J82_08975 [Coriobacteriia bacterium]|nr:hypothetical protein [Coriobacteriia bacterium]
MDVQSEDITQGRNDDTFEKAPRRKSGRVWIAIVAVLVLALIGAAVYLGLQQMGRQRAAESDLDEAVTILTGVEDAVIAVDEVVQAEIVPGLEATATAALDMLPQARKDLAEAIELLTGARVDLREDDQVLAQALQTAAEARSDMLQEAEPILSANKAAAEALQLSTDAWALVAEAEKLSQDAVAQYNKHTKDSVTQSTEFSKQAVQKLTTARSAMATATVAFPDAKLQQFVDYIDARQKLLESSMSIDATWLAGKLEEANGMLAAYATQETALIEQGKTLPASPSIAIADAYEALAAEATDRYFMARDRARAADDRVRELETTPTGE